MGQRRECPNLWMWPMCPATGLCAAYPAIVSPVTALALWARCGLSMQWVEFLCFDINVHVPHHVMSKIPWYNLRAATDSLRQVGNSDLNDVTSIALLRSINNWGLRYFHCAELGRVHD